MQRLVLCLVAATAIAAAGQATGAGIANTLEIASISAASAQIVGLQEEVSVGPAVSVVSTEPELIGFSTDVARMTVEDRAVWAFSTGDAALIALYSPGNLLKNNPWANSSSHYFGFPAGLSGTEDYSEIRMVFSHNNQQEVHSGSTA